MGLNNYIGQTIISHVEVCLVDRPNLTTTLSMTFNGDIDDLLNRIRVDMRLAICAVSFIPQPLADELKSITIDQIKQGLSGKRGKVGYVIYESKDGVSAYIEMDIVSSLVPLITSTPPSAPPWSKGLDVPFLITNLAEYKSE